MKAMIVKLMIPLLLTFVSSSWADTEVSGTWKLNVVLGGAQAGTATFNLKAKGDGSLTGTYRGAAGEADVSGTVDGNSLQFAFDSLAGEVTYVGTLDGSAMSGTCDYGFMGEGTFSGQRL